MEYIKFEPTGYSLKIFKDRYAFTPDETWDQACRRVAKQMALAESPDKQTIYEEKFYDSLVKNLFTPGGRIWYNSGRNNPQLLNCFVLDPAKDSKQGWGNTAKNVIVTSMTGGGCGDDFSDVRPRGATINGQAGSAPGAVELMRLVDGCAEPIRAGGQRRVALMFSLDITHPDLEEFLSAKLVKGELTHANVSVRSKKTTDFINAVKGDMPWELSWKGKYKKLVQARDIWKTIVTNAYNSAEPGFLNWELTLKESNIWYIEDLVTTNPCQPGYATVLTPEGIRTFNDISIGSTIWSGSKWTKVVNKWSTGIKPVYKYSTTTGHFIGTENHRILENGEKVEVQNANSIDWSVGPNLNVLTLNKQDIMDGLVLGDGSVHKASNNLVGLYIGAKDGDYFESEISSLIKKARPGISQHFHEINTTITASELPKTYQRVIPDRFYYGDNATKAGFLRGLFTANGSISGNRVTLKQTSRVLIEQVQTMLSSLGIHSYITTNKGRKNTFANGEYEMKESYDLNITTGRSVFKNAIGFIQRYKNEGLVEGSKAKYLTSDIKKVEYIEDTEVFDITVEDEAHTYWTGGCLVSNCGEQPLSAWDCCDLGHLVLSRFVNGNDMDWHELANTVRTGVRFLDNVLSVNEYPLPEMKEKSSKLRRIGLGTTALADTLALLSLRYGSDEANAFIDKLYRFISKTAYEASIMLAVEKGAFPACVPEKHVESGFMKRMPAKIKELVKEHGIRNCTILTVAPTGTVSIVAGNCSSGIEPMYSAAYNRKFWDKDERKTELVFHPLFAKFMKEGKDVSHFTGAHQLKVRDHLEVQRIVQKHIDSAVSKTINIPQDYPIEDMEALWLEYLPSLKGTTFYRENTRGYVDKDGNVQEPPLTAIPLEEAKAMFNETATTEAAKVVDCSSGICDL